MSLGTFEHTWKRGDYWAFAALAPGQLPATADERDAVQATIAFERVAAPAQAVRAYEAAVARWPQSLVVGIGLGNAQHLLARAPAHVLPRHFGGHGHTGFVPQSLAGLQTLVSGGGRGLLAAKQVQLP
jgi:hypothetical protein